MKDIIKIVTTGIVILILGLSIVYVTIQQQNIHPLLFIGTLTILQIIVPTFVGFLSGLKLKHSGLTITGGGVSFFTFWPCTLITLLFVHLDKVNKAIEKINNSQNINHDQMVSISIKFDIVSAIGQVFIWILLGTIGAWIARKFMKPNNTDVKMK